MFRALADATRRDILRQSMQHDLSVSDLARNYAMSFAAVQKHVATLARARLVTKRRHGREQLVRAVPDAVQRTARLLDEYEALWRHRADRISDLITEDTPPEARGPRS